MTALRSSRRKGKKGQLGMMELFMIIFVLFIILGLGMYYFYKFYLGSLKETGAEICEQSSTQQLSSILWLPEIRCSNYAHDSIECIDIAKLMSFKGSPTINKSISRGVCQKSITFVQRYPPPPEEVADKVCTAQDFNMPNFPDNCGKWILYQPKEKVKKTNRYQPIMRTPVALYFPTKNQYRIGMLEMQLYIKK